MFNIQPKLENDKAILYPLQAQDYEALYAVAADPAIWEQHPNKDRWRKEVFQTFFTGALESKGAFLIIDKATGQIAGSSRFYEYDEAQKSIAIGYTFYGTQYWGKGLNPSVKGLMLNYAFQFVDQVIFHVGANNLRSQIAIERVGAKKMGELEITYYGEPPKLNFLYAIEKAAWQAKKNGAL